MKDGKLFFSIDDRGRRKINVAEIDRLYEKIPAGAKRPEAINVNDPDANTEFNVKDTVHLIAMLDQKIEHLEREAKARSADVEKWQEAFERTQSTADKITALIEGRSFDARNTGDQDEKIDNVARLLEKQANETSGQDKKILTPPEFGVGEKALKTVG
jgi:hypothetical protein